LSEIRSDACNKILLMLSGLAVFGVTVIVARLLEQGATPVMGVSAATASISPSARRR
jgi:hypothetical protein